MTETTEYPRVRKLIDSGAFASDHYASDLTLSNPIIPALEFFLSLEDVTGFQSKYEKLLKSPVGSPSRNDRIVGWASMCAELGAIYLLAQGLKAQIVGFDRTSPKATRRKSDCDIIAVVNGRLFFIEVKRKASQDKQEPPETLEAILSTLALPRNICGVELRNRNYNCSDPDVEAAKIKEHVERAIYLGEEPWPFATDDYRITFGPGANTPNTSCLFDPVFSEDLEPHLLGPSEKENMVSMVEQAREKGADYLFCRTPKWEGWPAIVSNCFASVSYSNGRTYFTGDSRIHGLRGIVLFSRYDDFCVVNNLNEGNSAWLAP
jgi:hypothetical protein